MSWLKRDLTKAGIAIAGMLLLLVLMLGLPVSAAGAYEKASGLATPVTGTVQATPTEDATVTALNKEKLEQEVQQLKNQMQNQSNWFFSNSTALIAALSAIIVALFGISQWAVNRRDERRKEITVQNKELEDRKAEREKRAEERFQSVVEGLGSTSTGTQVGAAIMLRTFLRPGYEQFYTQTFDLAVANLRLRGTSEPAADPNIPLPLTTLSQALIVVFKEAFPLARSQNKGSSESLDATDVQLDKAYLKGADLKGAWMPLASLRQVNLSRADLEGANLNEANLSRADLSHATLLGAKLNGAKLNEATLKGATLKGATLKGATLKGATLKGANLQDALSLGDTDLRGVSGLTKEQLEACKAKGAIIG